MLDPGFYNMDCMEGMKEFPDKYFDLAIVDPPYGGGGRAEDADAGNLAGGGTDWEKHKNGRFGGRFRQYHFANDDQGGPDGRRVLSEIQARGPL